MATILPLLFLQYVYVDMTSFVLFLLQNPYVGWVLNTSIKNLKNDNLKYVQKN